MNLFIRTAVFCLVFLCITVKIITHGHIHKDQRGGRNRPHGPPETIRNTYLQVQPEDMVQSAENSPPSRQESVRDEEGHTTRSQEVDSSVNPQTHRVHETIETQCPACFLRREEAKRYRIEYIKRTILAKLHMTNPPNNSNVVLPRNPELTRLMNEYFHGPNHTPNSMQNDDPRSSTSSSTLEKMILFPKKPPSHWNINENTSYAFTFSERLFNYDVRDASLHIHVRSRRTPDADSMYYLTLRRVHDPPDGSNNPKIESVSKKKIQLHAAKGHWVVLDFTSVAREWLENPEEHNVIQISLVDADGNAYNDLVDTNIDSTYRKRSFLMMNIKEKRHHRLKRDMDTGMMCLANSPMTSCCRYAMVVDFEEIGWDWIIAPRRYDANYCQGECPRMYMLEYAHTHIIESIGSLPTGGTGPCCSPRQISDLTMLHTDMDENIKITHIAAMVVDSCHCS